MTRKQAILQAIELLSSNKQNLEIVNKLQDILDELSLSAWTKKSVIDAIETFAIEHDNILPHTREFTIENKLPSVTVIYNKFNTTSINTFLKKYFPQFNIKYKKSSHVSKYDGKDKNYFLNTFTKNYCRIQNETGVKYVFQNLYNKNREKNAPHITTIIKKCDCGSYEELLIMAGFKLPKKEIETTISVLYNDSEERNEELRTLFIKS